MKNKLDLINIKKIYIYITTLIFRKLYNLIYKYNIKLLYNNIY